MGVVRIRNNRGADAKQILGSRRMAWCVGTLILLALIGHVAGFASAHEAASAVQGVSQLPVGLIVPVSLENALEVKNAQKGTPLESRVMQEVPLAGREKIPLRSIVKGAVLAVVQDSDGSGVSVTIAFTTLDDRKNVVSMSASLRAIASYIAVRDAQTPWTAGDSGTPADWANTIQIGGDVRYGDGGVVRTRTKQKVGKGVFGGVLVHVQENPKGGCEGPVNGDDRLQALWVFSADACGVYGLKDVKIAHAGRSEPAGEITLHFAKRDTKLDAGTAMLLRVVQKP